MDDLMNATASIMNGTYLDDNGLMEDIISAIDQSVIVAITNDKGKIISVNQQFCLISKYSAEDLIGQDHRILNSGYHSSLFFEELWQTIRSGQVWQGEISNRAKDGSIYWVKTKIVPFTNETGKPYRYISIHTDITEQKSAQKFRHLAYHDEITGLENRRKLKTIYNQKKLNFDETDYCLLLMSINQYKQINEGYGYQTGDLFLIKVTEKLQQLTATGGTVYRYLEDQFVIICKNSQRECMIQRIIAVFNTLFTIEGHEFYSSVSIGVRSSILVEKTFEDVVRTAGIALSKAKEIKGNSFAEYDLSMNISFKEFIVLEKKLRHALEQEILTLYYQPKFDVKTRQIKDVEALLRWNDSELGWISPDIFIPLAEQTGLMTKIGEFVIRKACKQAVYWRDILDVTVKIAVNISPQHLKDSNFVESVKLILTETNCTADLIEIEITENSLLNQSDILNTTFTQLKSLGITIALDDFGKGFSSLSYLKNFPIDTLKIDREFVMGMTENSSESKMVTAIIGLARIFNMTVVAEGVETATECMIVEEAECDYIQGYFLSKPLPVVDIERLLLQKHSNNEYSY